MGNFERITRLAKSYVGFGGDLTEDHSSADIKFMINELGFQMSAQALAFMLDSDVRLQDFIMSIYEVRKQKGVQLLNDQKLIDTKYSPKVYEEDGKLAFSVQVSGQEIIFYEEKFPQ